MLHSYAILNFQWPPDEITENKDSLQNIFEEIGGTPLTIFRLRTIFLCKFARFVGAAIFAFLLKYF